MVLKISTRFLYSVSVIIDRTKMRSIHRCRQRRRAMRQAQAAEVKTESEKDNTTKTEPTKTDAVKSEPEQQAITREVKSEPVQHNPLYHFRGIQPTSRSIRDNPLLRINF